jgi:hypothetical protein
VVRQTLSHTLAYPYPNAPHNLQRIILNGFFRDSDTDVNQPSAAPKIGMINEITI